MLINKELQTLHSAQDAIPEKQSERNVKDKQKA